jgi:hypothetical protein
MVHEYSETLVLLYKLPLITTTAQKGYLILY